MTIRMTTRVASLLFLSFLAVPMSGVRADTLNFTEVGGTADPGIIIPSPVVNLSNAVLISSGTQMFIGSPGIFGESNNLGIACASPGGGDDSCETNLQINFNSPVINLSFGSFGVSDGDNVTVSAFLGGSFLGSTVVTTQTTVDFSGLGTIDELFFADASDPTTMGIGWGDFLFNTAPPVNVPEPGLVALLGLGLSGLAALRRRKG